MTGVFSTSLPILVTCERLLIFGMRPFVISHSWAPISRLKRFYYRGGENGGHAQRGVQVADQVGQENKQPRSERRSGVRCRGPRWDGSWRRRRIAIDARRQMHKSRSRASGVKAEATIPRTGNEGEAWPRSTRVSTEQCKKRVVGSPSIGVE